MTTVALPSATSVQRPRYEGANIRSWIGFKHFMYLLEEAVLDWFRKNAAGARQLYCEHGLGLEIIDSSVQLPRVLELDDEVQAEVVAVSRGRFAAAFHVRRDGRDVLVLRGKVTVALVREVDPPQARPLAALPQAHLAPEPVDQIAAADPTWLGPAHGWVWSWRAPYFYCHFSDRVQHSGYIRALEEVVDRFLAERGLSVAQQLRERGWIPVVSRARVRMLAAAHMEEVVHTTFVVDDILRGTLFDGRMDCYVERAGGVVHTATARILHGYAISRGPEAGSMATLDAAVITALTGNGSP